MSRYPAPVPSRSDWSQPLHRYERHRAAIHAKLATLAVPSVVSHSSAAVLHRLPLPSLVLTEVHVTRPDRKAARRSPVLHTHGAQLAAQDIVEIDGVLVTSAARTVVDCAKILPFAAAVELSDAAVTRGLVTMTELLAEAGRPRVPGSARIREVVHWTDPGSRIATDSRHRLQFVGLVAQPARAHVLLPYGIDDSLVCADVWLPAERVAGVVLDAAHPQAPPCAAPRLTADRCRSLRQPFLSWFTADLGVPGTVEQRWTELMARGGSGSS